jgi:hypothetical protein
MIRQPMPPGREEIVARAVAPVAAELRLVDAADYVAFIRLEERAALADLVASAAEPFFMPGALRLGGACDFELDWGAAPRVTLDLELCLVEATVYFQLVMDADSAGVEINYCSFAAPDADEAANTAFLRAAVEHMRIRPSLAASATLSGI